jgi:hypothetical protein
MPQERRAYRRFMARRLQGMAIISFSLEELKFEGSLDEQNGVYD